MRFKKKSGKNCIICSSPTSLFAEKGEHAIYKCINCGFGYTDKLYKQSGDYHRDETYIIEEKLFKNIFSRRINQITRFIKTGKVLEIGCSTGLMLSLFKIKGFDAKGVELSRKAAEKAIEKGIDVKIAFFEKINFSEKFDLVVLNHTLEHMENPVGVLKKVKSILNPKGYVMIDLPNFDSPAAKILKSRWPHLLPDEHLWHFTPKAFNVLFKKMDFKIVNVSKTSGIWDFENPYKEIAQSFIGFKKRFIGNVLTLIPSFVMTKLNKGSDLLVIARKK